MVRLTLLVTLLLITASGAVAYDDKIDGKLLIGKWEPEKVPPGRKITIEFKKDNKVVIETEFQGNEQKIEGTYKIENDQLTVTLTRDGQEKTQNNKILKLTEKEVTLRNDEIGEEQTLKKVS